MIKQYWNILLLSLVLIGGCATLRSKRVTTGADLQERRDCRAGLPTACMMQCRAHHAASCYRLSSMYDKGIGDNYPNPTTSARVLKKACALKHADACYQLGRRTWEGWQQHKADPKTGLKLIGQSCLLRSGHACFYLYTLYYEGDLVARNTVTARTFLARSCQLNYQKACRHPHYR